MKRVSASQERVRGAYEFVAAKGVEFVELMETSPWCREACKTIVRLAVKLFLAGLPCSIVHGYRVESWGGYFILVREGTRRGARYVVSREEVEELQGLLGRLGIYSRVALERLLEVRVSEFLSWAGLSALTYTDMRALKLRVWGACCDRGVTRLPLAVRYIEAAASGARELPASEAYERLRLRAERYLELRGSGVARLAARLFLAGLPATAAAAFSPVERGGLLAVKVRGARGVYEYYLSRGEAEGILSALSEARGVHMRRLQAATKALKRGIGVEELTYIDVYNLKLRAWGMEWLSSPKYRERWLRMVLKILSTIK